MPRFPLLWILALLATVGAACSTSSPTTPNYDAPNGESTVILLDETLAHAIQLTDQMGLTDPATGTYLAEVLISNKTFEWLELECRTLFRNAEGATLETSPWKPVRLDPASRVAYAAPSLKPDVSRFITQIRRAPIAPSKLTPFPTEPARPQ